MVKQILFLLLLLPITCWGQDKLADSIDINKAAFKILKAGIKPDFLAVDGADIWVIDDHQSRIIKLSATVDTPLLIVTIPKACTAPIVGFNALWVMSCSEKVLYKIDHHTGKVLAKIATGMADNKGEMSLAVAGGSVWLLGDSAGVLLRIDPSKNAVIKSILVKPNSFCAAAGKNAVWITNYLNNTVQKINTKTNRITATIAVGMRPRFITTTGHWVFTLNQGDGTISKINTLTNKLVAAINVHAIGGGGDISAGGKKVWVKSTNPQRPLQTINIATNKIESIFYEQGKNDELLKVDGAVRVAKNFIWVSGYFNKTIWIFKR